MTVVKICGITNIEDARVAVEAGADMLGFIFYPPSPRYLTPEQAREIISAIRLDASPRPVRSGESGSESARTLSAVQFAGIFVNEPLEQIRSVMETAGLDLAQLHGTEAPEMVRELGGHAYKSLQARDLDSARALVANYRDAVHGDVPAFIADAPPAKLPGGNGMIADWSVAREIAKQFPILLAGGLNVENVCEAIEMVQPWGVDVSSGVERAPGLKDHEKVREFVKRAKE
jgi:phosphoribosylanthranilate isomerase